MKVKESRYSNIPNVNESDDRNRIQRAYFSQMGRDKADRSRGDGKSLKLLGQRLKQARLEKGLSLEQLGLIIEKDRQSIYRVESGKINVGYLYLVKLCEGLGISISELLKDLE